MRTNVYIDGFNLYYLALKDSPYKWLNLRALCEKLLPESEINEIKLFAARVKSRPWDPDQPTRQDAYFRALATLPGFSLIEGHFSSHPKDMALVTPIPGYPRKVSVYKEDEKGSDVNLASHLLYDAFADAYDVGVVVSCDSDLETPIRMAREKLGKSMVVLQPHRKQGAKLRAAANFDREIRKSHLAASQFPRIVHDARGRAIHCPERWVVEEAVKA